MDRMTIVGTDGQDRMLIDEDGLVIELVCPFYTATKTHVLPATDMKRTDPSRCFYCGQTVQVLRNKGEEVVQ